MSSAKKPHGKEPETLQSTRQMLDELDALMDRMLTLPVNDVDDAPPPPAIVRMPAMSATLTVLEAPANENVEDKIQERMLEKPAPIRERAPALQESFPSYTTEFESDSVNTDSVDSSSVDSDEFLFRPGAKGFQAEVEPASEEVLPPAVTKLAVPATKPKPTGKRKRTPQPTEGPSLFLPLQWFNRVFDVPTLVLGPLGSWLRGPGGRRALGWSGFALLAAAGVWFAKDFFGWTW
jgi:hypothetical protein